MLGSGLNNDEALLLPNFEIPLKKVSKLYAARK